MAQRIAEAEGMYESLLLVPLSWRIMGEEGWDRRLVRCLEAKGVLSLDHLLWCQYKFVFRATKSVEN